MDWAAEREARLKRERELRKQIEAARQSVLARLKVELKGLMPSDARIEDDKDFSGVACGIDCTRESGHGRQKTVLAYVAIRIGDYSFKTGNVWISQVGYGGRANESWRARKAEKDGYSDERIREIAARAALLFERNAQLRAGKDKAGKLADVASAAVPRRFNPDVASGPAKIVVEEGTAENPTPRIKIHVSSNMTVEQAITIADFINQTLKGPK